MANDLIVRILGDTKGLERSFARANQTTAQFGRNIETTGTKIDKTARSFSSFARGAAAGFGGAVALNVAVDQLRAVVTAAAESQQVLGQTRVALESTGKSWADYGREIEDAIAAQSRLGFDDEALFRTFSLFVRQSDDVGEALRRNNIAMDIARARFIDLEQAAAIVNKAALGQAGALRRLGIDARTGATGIELLAQLERDFGGAAEDASTDASTAFQRLQVSLENVQETIGSGLLPILSDFARALSDAADGATLLVGKLRDLGNVRIPVIEVPIETVVNKVAGSGFAEELGKNLLGPLGDLIQLGDAFEDETKDVSGDLSRQVSRAFGGLFDDLAQAGRASESEAEKAAGVFEDIRKNALEKARKALDAAKESRARFVEDARRAAEQARSDRANALIAGLQLGVDRAALTSSLRDDLASLQAFKTGLEGLIRQGQDVQENQARLVGVIGEIAAKRLEIERAARDALQARQFRALGLSATGDQLIPGVENLRKQLSQLTERIGTREVSSKIRSQLKGIGRVLSGELGDITEETRSRIRDLLQTIRGGLNDLTKAGPLTKTSSLNANKVLEGLGLGRDMEKELRARLSSFNSAGRALAAGGNRPTGQFVGGATIVVENHNTTTLDGEVVGRNVTKSQQKARRRNPKQKRGPNSGI